MKDGFRVMDSDLHTMEPDDLWFRYLDEPKLCLNRVQNRGESGQFWWTRVD